MTITSLNNHDLITSFERAVASERKIIHLVLQHILEIESRKIYADLGYDSMFSYLTQKHGYCESSAYARIQSARLLKQAPDVANKLESGSLKLSQLTKVQKCLTAESKQGRTLTVEQAQDLLQKIENKNLFETEKILATELDLPLKAHETTKPQKDDSIRLEITLTSEEFETLQKAKSLLSHTCPEGSWAQVITVLAKKFSQNKLGKISAKVSSATQSFAAKEVSTKYRPFLPINTQRELLKKAQYKCEYRDHQTHNACNSTYQLQIDHIKPLSLGGGQEITNLRILCRTHNNLMAKRSGLGTHLSVAKYRHSQRQQK